MHLIKEIETLFILSATTFNLVQLLFNHIAQLCNYSPEYSFSLLADDSALYLGNPWILWPFLEQ
jgi:hypothetical protein